MDLRKCRCVYPSAQTKRGHDSRIHFIYKKQLQQKQDPDLRNVYPATLQRRQREVTIHTYISFIKSIATKTRSGTKKCIYGYPSAQAKIGHDSCLQFILSNQMQPQQDLDHSAQARECPTISWTRRWNFRQRKVFRISPSTPALFPHTI